MCKRGAPAPHPWLGDRLLSLTWHSACFLQTPKLLFGKSQLRQEILEQDYKGNLELSSGPDFFFFFPLSLSPWSPVSLYDSGKKMLFQSARKSEENFLPRKLTHH